MQTTAAKAPSMNSESLMANFYSPPLKTPVPIIYSSTRWSAAHRSDV